MSKSALKELSIVHPNFPEVYNFCNREEANSVSMSENTGYDCATCGCLKRTETPEEPPKPPCALTMGNRKVIEKAIMDYYASSVFNKCEHQTLPKLEGEPMKIFVDETMVKPPAVNTLAKIPLAWEEKVKSDIARNVRLGVIEMFQRTRHKRTVQGCT